MLDPHVDPESSDGPGAEPAYCPACELQHMRRPDWLCPRCGSPVETGARRPGKRARAAAAEYAPADYPRGSVVAGAIMAATGIVLAIGFARHPVAEHRWPLLAATAVLLVLGIELLLKVSAARWIAIAVAALAALAAAEDLLRARVPDLTRDPLPPAVRAAVRDAVRALDPTRLLLGAALLAGTVLLVAGRPGRVRLAAGALLAAPLAVAEIVRALGS